MTDNTTLTPQETEALARKLAETLAPGLDAAKAADEAKAAANAAGVASLRDAITLVAAINRPLEKKEIAALAKAAAEALPGLTDNTRRARASEIKLLLETRADGPAVLSAVDEWAEEAAGDPDAPAVHVRTETLKALRRVRKDGLSATEAVAQLRCERCLSRNKTTREKIIALVEKAIALAAKEGKPVPPTMASAIVAALEDPDNAAEALGVAAEPQPVEEVLALEPVEPVEPVLDDGDDEALDLDLDDTVEALNDDDDFDLDAFTKGLL